MAIVSADLQALCAERERLITAIAPTLRRPGPHYPGDRNKEDRRRRRKRNTYRAKLHANADAITNLVMTLYRNDQ